MSEKILNRTWQERLGGPYALSIRAFVITSLLALAYTSQIQSFGTQKVDVVIKWILIYLVTIVVIGILNLLLAYTTFADRAIKPVSVFQAMLSHGFLGLIFSVSMVVGADFLGLAQNLNVPFQIALSFILSLWWGSSFAIFLDHRAENQIKRRELIEKALLTESLTARQHESRIALDEIFKSELSADLANAQVELEASAEQVNWQGSSTLIKKTAQEHVRPMSHALINAKVLSYPRIRWWRLPFNIVNNQPINTWLIILIALVGGGPQQVQLLGVERALLMMVSLYLLIAVVGTVANKLMVKFSNRHALIFITASLFMQISIPINKYFRDIWVPGNSTLQWQIQQLLSGLLLILAASGFGAWSDINRRLNANFSQDIDHERIRAIAASRLIAEQSRNAARLLHGAVQTKLIACAMAIDQATITGDEYKINEAISQALTILRSPLTEQGFGATLSEEIHRKVNLWNEICEISITIDPLITNSNPDLIVQVGRIIEEAISNAIRHGRAKSISISLTKNTGDQIEISVVDDGLGPQGGKPSLGSALLDQASGGNWVLRSTGNGSQLQLSIAGR
jgi:signal transduction histidine kinase